MVDRRKSQNYQALPQYLTEEHWTSFEKQPRERSQSALLAHAWNLGLRCPSEGSFAVIFNLLQLTCRSDVHSSTSSFQKYQALQTLKKTWKKYKTGRRAEDNQYAEYLEVLPTNVEDLPAEYYLQAFQHDAPVQPRILAMLKTFEWFYISFFKENVWNKYWQSGLKAVWPLHC